MKILILEPHGDDALLSCNSILETDNDISIITFADYRSSEGLKEYYPSVKYTEYLDHSNLWYDEGKFPWKTHEIHKNYQNGINIFKKYIMDVHELFKERYDGSLIYARDAMKERISELYDVVVCPTGIVHPYHLVINEAWTRLNEEMNIPTLYYADKYYIQNRYGKELYESAKNGLLLDSEINSDYKLLLEENTKIAEILCKVYPTEGKLLRFYNDIITKYPCKYAYNSKYNKELEVLINELVR